MSLDMRITQGRTVFLDLLVQQRRLDGDVRKAIREMTATYRARVVAELRSAKSGKKYGARSSRAFYRRVRTSVTLFGGAQGSFRRATRVKGKTRAYTASAPGQAPAVFTGTLARSVRTKVRGKGWQARVFADKGTAFYRHFLEFGTGPRSTKRPRRFVGALAKRPIWSRYQAQIERELPQRVLTAIERFQRGG
jgi:hypothetical protein